MKKLLLAVCALFGFMACTQNPIEEQSAIRTDVPETIKVGFEDSETRIQLNEAQKTVWTKDDLVSVFYLSNANQKWQYQGETGERVGNLKRVENATATAQTSKVVVVYPYRDDHYLNYESCNLHATLPATQYYTKGSYGVGSNLMVSQSEFTQFSLKSVCGWLKLQLTGDGEVVKSIKFRGNNDEQVAGLIYVDTATAEATLASEMGSSDDNNAGGNLIFDDAVVTEVTLDCGEGVVLDEIATSFYIALPPQTFANGFTVEIEDNSGYVMTQSTSKQLVVERNTIQPMSVVEFVNPNTPATPTPANNEIWYTATELVEPYFENVFGATINSNSFDPETGMGVIAFDGEVAYIGKDAFNGCKKLLSITLPDSVTYIGDNAFYNCSALASVDLGNSVTSIRSNAFDSCKALATIDIPNSVTTISSTAFLNCSGLSEYRGKFASNDGRYLSINNVLYCFAPARLTEYTIPDGVTSIGEYAFYYCTRLVNVAIPNSVTRIGDYAFDSCISLTGVTIPDNVTSIGARAFYWSSDLTTITIGSSITSIGYEAFYNCSKLKDVYCNAPIPPYVGSWAFGINDIGLKFYVYDESVVPYKISWSDYASSIVSNGKNCPDSTIITYTSLDGNIVTSKRLPIISNSYDNGIGTMVVGGVLTEIPPCAFEDCINLTSIIIPDGVTSIGNYAFWDCSNLTNITIPDGVTSIGRLTFSDCIGLKSVALPDSVTIIGEAAFSDCSGLISITIPNRVTSIGSEAFHTCSSLTSVVIGSSVAEIGASAFSNCDNLKSVYITDLSAWFSIYFYTYANPLYNGANLYLNNELVTELVIPSDITEIKAYAFYNCNSLTSVIIQDGVTAIESYAFYSCDNLTSIAIPDSVTTIGKYAFEFCSLTSVTIPANVTTIKEYAFAYCSSLKDIYCKATTPPTTYSSMFSSFSDPGRTIYVPIESVEAYKSADGWKNYADAIVGYEF